MKSVVFTSPFVPAELIEAHGLWPRRILFDGSGNASAFGHIEGLCPYADACVAGMSGAHAADAVVLATTCDPMRRAADLIQRESAIPLFLLNVPAAAENAAGRTRYAGELQRLGRFLGRLGGRAPSREELASSLCAYDDRRRELKALREGLSPRQYAEALAGFFRTNRVQPDSLPQGPPSTGIPIAIVGGPLPLTELWLFDVIERNGGRIVLNGTESGERTLPAPFDRRRIDDDPFGTMADAYWGAIPDIFQRPNTHLYEWLKCELPRRGARGIVVRHYAWCDLWHAEVPRLAEWARVPLLHIDVDKGCRSRERTETRLQAFLEVLR